MAEKDVRCGMMRRRMILAGQGVKEPEGNKGKCKGCGLDRTACAQWLVAFSWRRPVASSQAGVKQAKVDEGGFGLKSGGYKPQGVALSFRHVRVL